MINDCQFISSKGSVGISTGSIHSILMKTLLIKKVSARWVPQMFSDTERQIELTH